MNGPVGFFDSGVGGLTVLKAFLKQTPNLSFIYVGDTAHCPYGDRPLDEVRTLALDAIQTLVNRGCRRVIFACNISSSVALEEASLRFPNHEMHGLVSETLASQVRARSSGGRVGVLATSGTVESGRYETILSRENLSVLQQACPQLVPLIESGRTEGPIVRQTLEPLLEPLLEFGADTIVLGCTHYPFLYQPLRSMLPDDVSLVDPGQVLAKTIPIEINGTRPETRTLMATGSTESLRRFVRRDPELHLEWMEPLEMNTDRGRSK